MPGQSDTPVICSSSNLAAIRDYENDDHVAIKLKDSLSIFLVMRSRAVSLTTGQREKGIDEYTSHGDEEIT